MWVFSPIRLFGSTKLKVGSRDATVAMAAAVLDQETTSKVLRQVEFYFSDSNLPRDKFLKKTIQESEDEMVSVSLICSFQRMRNHLGLKEVGPENVPEETAAAVVEVIRNSSSTLRVSEDGKRVGRVNKLSKPEEVLEQVDSRTIAAAPLPYDVKLEDVERFFNQHGKVNSVRLPRHVATVKALCGSALIEFSSEEEANAISKLNLVYDGADMEMKPKKDFDAERRALLEEINNGRGPSGNRWQNDSWGDSVLEDNSHPKGLIVAFTLKKSSEEVSGEGNDSKESAEVTLQSNSGDALDGHKSEEAMNTESPCEAANESKSGEAQKEEAANESNSGEAQKEKAANESKSGEAQKEEIKLTREDIKFVLQKYGTVKYVDYHMGAESGYVRFEQPEMVQKARAAAVLAEEGGLVVKNYIAVLEAVEGEAEKEYWAKLREGQDKRRQFAGNSRGRGGRGRGGRHSSNNRNSFTKGNGTGKENKHRRFEEDDGSTKDERPNKVQKRGNDGELQASEASKAVEGN